VDAGFDGIHGGGGLTCNRGGAGGLLGVTAIGFYLTEGRHSSSGSGLRPDGQGCPEGTHLSHFEGRGWIWGIREGMAVNGWKQGAKILDV
jgi:hypothetical protein